MPFKWVITRKKEERTAEDIKAGAYIFITPFEYNFFRSFVACGDCSLNWIFKNPKVNVGVKKNVQRNGNMKT